MKNFYTRFVRIMPQGIIIKSLVIIFMVGFATTRIHAQSGLCNTGVPFYVVDLTGSPSSTYTSPSGSRANNCCGTSSPDRCVEFEIMLHPGSTGIMFDIYTGAVPPGAMFYQINCGPEVPVGQSVCLSGQGPHTVTLCKPGNNPNSYIIKSIPAAYSIQDAVTRIGCSVNLKGEGLKASTVTWRDITGNGIYENLLSCTSGCNEAIFTPITGIPSEIKYEVCGSVLDTICNNYYLVCDTVTVTIFPEIDITLPSLFKYCSTSGGININPIVSGGNGNYSYTWRDSLGNVVSNSSNYFASKGNYTLSVADGFINCPPATAIFSVEEDLPAIVDAGVNQLICYGQTEIQLNGNIQLVPSGVWSGGTGLLDYSNTVLQNTYAITPQDSTNGYVQFILRSVGDTICPAVRDTVIYTISAPLVIQPDVTQISCNTTNSGSIIINVSGGSPGYLYSIDSINFQSSSTFSNLSEGNYRLWARDTAGCIASTDITIVPPMTMNANLSVNSPVCFGDSIQLNALANGATSYSWAGPNNFSASTNNTIINSAAIIHSGLYRVTITNGYCTITDSIAVNVLPAPVANAGRDTSVCGGNIVTIGGTPSATGGSEPYTYNWLPTTGLSNSNIANPAVVVTQTLNYILTVTDANGCSNSDIVEIILGRCNEICTAAKGPNILGAIGSFSAPYMVPNTAANICLINGLNSFSQTNNIALPKPTQTTYTYTSASGGLFPEGRYTFIKNLGDQTGASCLHSRFHAVDHTGDGGYFMAVNGSPNLALYGNTFFRLDSIPVCPNTNYEFSAFVTNILSGIYNQPSFQFPNISFYINNIIVATSGPIPNNPGQVLNDWIKAGGVWNSGSANYASIRIDNATVIATGNDLGIDDIVFSVCGPVIIDDNPNRSLCVGETFTISQNINSSGTTNYSYYKWQVSTNNGSTWSDASGIISETQSPTLYNAVLGPLTATLNMNGNLFRILAANDSLSLADNNSFCYAIGPPSIVSVRPSPTAFAGTDKTICINDSVTIGAAIVATGGTAPYQYLWNNTSSLSNNSIERPVAEPNTTTTYRLNVTDATGCVATDEVLVTVSNPKIINAEVNNITCFGYNNGSINITLNGGISPYSFNWSNNSIAEDLINIGAGNYTVSINDAIGCTASETYTITEPAPLAISNNKTDVSCFGGNNGSINITISGGTLPYTFNWNDGYILRDRTNLVAGNYSVTVTDANGCRIQTSVTINQPTAIVITGNEKPVTCYNGNDGAIDIAISGGLAPYSYNWSDGTTNVNAKNLNAGIYFVTVTDTHNCTSQASFNVTQPTEISITFLTTNATCYGYNDGSITADATGGTSPYTYEWSTSANNNFIQNLTAGNYLLTITDSNGCVVDSSAIIAEPDSINISAVIQNVLCYGNNDGSIMVNASGGNAPYTYHWSNNWNFELNRHLAEGEYTLTVTDNNNCSKIETYYVSQPNELEIVLTGTRLICINANNGSIQAGVSGGTPNYNYNWSNGDSFNNINNLTNGNYAVTVRDANGCVATSQYNIDEYDYSADILLSDNEICLGEPITFNIEAISDTGIHSLLWLFSDNTLSVNTTVNKIFTIAGNHSASVSVLFHNGCLVNTTAPFFVNALPVVNAGDDKIICPGNSTTLEAGGAQTYIWTSDAAFSTINNSAIRTAPSDNATYFVSGTDTNGCINTDSVQVFIHETLPLQISNDTLLCSGTTVNLNVSGAQSYQWLPSEYLSCDTCNTTLATTNSTTLFLVNAIDINGCSVSDSVTVYITPMPVGLLNRSMTTCLNNEVTLRAFPEANTTYQWYPDSLLSNANSNSITVNPIETTTYTLSSTTSFGCNKIDSITVVVLQKPEINISDTISYCKGNSYQINLDSTLQYFWQPSTGLSCNNCPSPVLQSDSSMRYIITISTADGCLFTDSIQLNVLELPAVSLSENRKICNGETVNITAETAIATSIVWYPTNGLNNSSSRIVQASPDTTTRYMVQVSDSNGCINRDTVLIEVFSKVKFNLDSLINICRGESVVLAPTIITANDAHLHFQWLPENAFNNAHADSQQLTPDYSARYQLIISSGACIPDTQSFYINVHQSPSVVLNAPEYVIAGSNFEVKAHSTGANLYNWQYDTINATNYEGSIVTRITQPTMFVVNVVNEHNCSATQYKMVQLIDRCGDDIFIPNAFTPNGDEINDKLCIRSLELQAIKIFRVFNRWGELVFETTDINHCWDGYFKGKVVNSDVYVYYAEGICTNGQSKLMKGNVTVMR